MILRFLGTFIYIALPFLLCLIAGIVVMIEETLKK